MLPPIPHRCHSVLIRLWRLGLLTLAVLLIRDAALRQASTEAVSALTAERVRDFFPNAVSLGTVQRTSGWRPVLGNEGETQGFVTTTAPESTRIIGYSGPTNVLLAFNIKGRLVGLRVLQSGDTAEHLAEVIADRKYFAQFRDKLPQEIVGQQLNAVSGATLTSFAITEGVLNKLGQSTAASLRFPEEITLEEVQRLEPNAASLAVAKTPRGALTVLDAAGKPIALAVRTSPVTDSLVGYKGPTDTLVMLDPSGTTLRRIALRKSFDTRRYVNYVTSDDYFLNLFNGMTLGKLAALDFKGAKIEGVSGATETSWAVAEGLKRRAQSLLDEKPKAWISQLTWRWQDTGHLIMIVSAFAMAFTKLRGRPWIRHLHHALLVIYGGFIAGELLSQGLLVGWASHGTPWRSAPGLVLLAAVALLGPVFTSKHLYCHHLCAHGALQQLVARRLRWQLAIPAKADRWLAKLPIALLAFVLIAAVTGLRVDLNSIEPFDAYVVRIAGWTTITIAIVGLVFALFTPLAYCKYGCPTGALFRLLRFTGHADHFGLRDWLAAAALGLAAMLRFLPL